MTRRGAIVHELLDEYGALALGAMREHLQSREPRRHLYDLVTDYPERGGRALRASLCIATARAFGAQAHDAVQSAAALEILHNAFLVHDDVEDDSDERRGHPTIHMLYGVPIAINVGDALALSSLRPLFVNRFVLGPELAFRILEEVETMARESIEGQAIELGWRRDNAIALRDEDYLHMVLKKTCVYTTIYPFRIGALIGTHGRVDVDPFTRFCFFLGAAFQIQDDLLNLVGDKRAYGKEIAGDLWEGKRSLVLIRLLQLASQAERGRVRELLARPRQQKLAGEVRWLRERIDAYDCIEYARRVAHGLAGAALHEAERVLSVLHDSRDKRFLQALPVWMLERA
jgi:geranylgeranyl diphosphate synthase, type II